MALSFLREKSFDAGSKRLVGIHQPTGQQFAESDVIELTLATDFILPDTPDIVTQVGVPAPSPTVQNYVISTIVLNTSAGQRKIVGPVGSVFFGPDTVAKNKAALLIIELSATGYNVCVWKT